MAVRIKIKFCLRWKWGACTHLHVNYEQIPRTVKCQRLTAQSWETRSSKTLKCSFLQYNWVTKIFLFWSFGFCWPVILCCENFLKKTSLDSFGFFGCFFLLFTSFFFPIGSFLLFSCSLIKLCLIFLAIFQSGWWLCFVYLSFGSFVFFAFLCWRAVNFGLRCIHNK